MEDVAQIFMVAGVVIKKDGKYLLIQENRPSNKGVHGLWNLPAGRVEKGMTIEETAIKEAKEESGLDVELIRKLDIFQEKTEEPPKHAFEARIIGGELRCPEDEILDAKWFSLDEIIKMQQKLRGKWVLDAILINEKNK